MTTRNNAGAHSQRRVGSSRGRTTATMLLAAFGVALIAAGCAAVPASGAARREPAASPTATAAPVTPCCPGPGTSGAVPTPSPAPRQQVANYDDPAVPIEVAVGDTFTITLRELGPAGFRFSYVRRPDPAVVVEVNSTSQSVSPGLIGSPDARTWTFEAVGEGSTTIVVQQARVGTTPTGLPSKYGPAEDPQSFTINVRPAAERHSG